MKTTLRLLAAAAALGIGVVGAQAAAVQTPEPTIKVIGFAAIFDNDAHIVRARNGGVLRRCDDRRAFAAVLDIANVEGGLPYQVLWTRNGRRFFTGKIGESGSFDEVPNRIEFSFRKAALIPNGAYVFRSSSTASSAPRVG